MKIRHLDTFKGFSVENGGTGYMKFIQWGTRAVEVYARNKKNGLKVIMADNEIVVEKSSSCASIFTSQTTNSCDFLIGYENERFSPKKNRKNKVRVKP